MSTLEHGRVHLAAGSTSGQCPVCGQSSHNVQLVSLGEPAFLAYSNVETAGLIHNTSEDGGNGGIIVSVWDQVADAFRQQTHVRELLVCEHCIGTAAQLIGYGDLIEAEAEAARSDERARDAEQQLAELRERVVELEDTLMLSRSIKVELEATVRSLERRAGAAAQAQPEPEPGAEPERAPRSKRKSSS